MDIYHFLPQIYKLLKTSNAKGII